MTGKRKVTYTSSEESSSDESFISKDMSVHPGAEDNGILSGISQETRTKRGRAPSKRPCTNRNALMARVNRQKKKEYVENIETKLSHYKKANKNLVNVVQQQGVELKRLTAEVAYLRSVINNNTSITTLLKTMNESLRQSKCKIEHDKWDGEKLLPCPQVLVNRLSTTPPQPSAAGVDCDPSLEGGVDLLVNPNVINCTEDSQLGISDVDIGQLEDFGANIFDLPDDGEGDRMDLFRSDQSQPENLFDNLDGSGICLHVNSERISLEYCSICHLNSINSDDP
ncbi:uncharacterized protein LOC135162193 isoform X3 [Diachasmimorpha longicaudata]|uniref:uncharacterized protein LOC135162193 isoform X3 n=1 Tax=Diachasmimorpha longicaudata TaxID=58733 RepID=UPI0030B91C8A